MHALLVFALIVPVAQVPKPKEPAKPEVGFGLSAESEYHWPFYLLRSPDVRKELQVTKEQLAKLDGLEAELKKKVEAGFGLPMAKMRTHFATVTAWADKSAAELLTTEQRPRHRQVLWQVLEFNGGARAMAANPVFAKEIGLTADQQKQARKIDADYYAGWLKLVRANPLAAGGNGPVPGEEALAKKAEEAVLKLLKPDQKKQWNEALGEPFRGDIVQFPVPGIRPVTFKAPGEKK